MSTLPWNPEQIEAGMRALVRTVAPEGPLAPDVARMVEAVQRHIGCRYNADALKPIKPHVLAHYLVDPWLRTQLVRAIVVGMFLDPGRSKAGVQRLEEVARALGVDEPAVGDLALFVAGKRWRLRRRLISRFWVMDHIKARIAQRGLLRTVIPLIYSTLFRRYRNPELAARFATLRKLPAGTLGREYVRYTDENGFGLPGERGSVTDIIVPHDLAHVLSGYGTTPAEEVLVASFSAGHRAKDGFAFIVFVLLQFHLGVRMTPGAKAETGYFDPAKVLAAIVRGAAVEVDFTAEWDYWRDLRQPVDTLRWLYGIAPREAMPAAA
jgi:hypothetical protein